MINLILAFLAGGVTVIVSSVARKWLTKQVDDAKTHLPGA